MIKYLVIKLYMGYNEILIPGTIKYEFSDEELTYPVIGDYIVL